MPQDHPLTNLLKTQPGSTPIIIILVLLTAIAGATIGITLGSDPVPPFQDTSDRHEGPNAFKVESGHANVTQASAVDTIRLVVMKGDERIDVSQLTITWIGPSTRKALVNGTPSQMHATHRNVTVGNSLYFSIQPISDSDNSAPVLNDEDDRFRITMNATAIRGTPLQSSHEVHLKLKAADGSLELYTVTVPDTLQNKSEIKV